MNKFVNKTTTKRNTVRNGIGTQSDGGMFIVGTPKVRTIQDFPLFVHESIESPTDVVHHVDVLRHLEEGDNVTMYVSGVGGCVSSVDLLIHEMQSAQARGVHIHCVCTGLLASAFSFIPLYADSFELSEGFHALLHAGSAGMSGTIPEFKASSAFTIKYMESRLRSVYKHFLSEKELDDMLEGKDLWLDASAWVERFQKRNELFAEEADECECGHCGIDVPDEPEEEQPLVSSPKPPYASRRKKQPVQEEKE
jgi:ATP-dependent protease ClpP protease subunit